jgi:hypothetical protein
MVVQAWSITYHSWLTFVLLLWASILWILPNQRRSMMRCSPFLVVYAIFLLLAQYIYGMDLTDNELPDQVKGVNLRQIGFIKTTELPCEPLFIKVIYCFYFISEMYIIDFKLSRLSGVVCSVLATEPKGCRFKNPAKAMDF